MTDRPHNGTRPVVTTHPGLTIEGEAIRAFADPEDTASVQKTINQALVLWAAVRQMPPGGRVVLRRNLFTNSLVIRQGHLIPLVLRVTSATLWMRLTRLARKVSRHD